MIIIKLVLSHLMKASADARIAVEMWQRLHHFFVECK